MLIFEVYSGDGAEAEQKVLVVKSLKEGVRRDALLCAREVGVGQSSDLKKNGSV